MAGDLHQDILNYSKFPEVEHVLERIATLNSALTQVTRGTETNILL